MKQPSGGACLLNLDCQRGLYCEGENFSTMSKGVCAARKAAGETCSPNLPCVEDAYCSSTNVCAARKAEGQACSTTSECAEDTTCTSGVCRKACTDTML